MIAPRKVAGISARSLYVNRWCLLVTLRVFRAVAGVGTRGVLGGAVSHTRGAWGFR
jgi:hypothetical protein